MLRTLIIGLCLLAATVQNGLAQQRGQVTVVKDPLIDSLIARRQVLERASVPGGAVSSMGYRVQIFSGLSREDVYAEQSKFKAQYPNVTSYISYVQPNYRLRVGDFRSRTDAQQFLNALKKTYSSLFIFSERITPR